MSDMDHPGPDDHLARYIREITRIFGAARCKHDAHRQSRPVLEDIAADRTFITRVLRHYLMTPGVLNAKNYPVVGIDIALTPDYHLVANCWIPLPGRETNVSSKAIHHHGNMLLTTLTVFGPGYEHWLFTRPTLLDPERELYDMDVVERKRHALHNLAFVDAWEPHLPVYPGSLTITLCLWSNQYQTTWKDHIKRIPWLKRHDATLKTWAVQMGISTSLNLKVVSYFDFYPTEDGFQGMKQRIEFQRGPNEDHVHSVFHTIQQTGNDALTLLVERQLASGAAFANPELIRQMLQALRAGRQIEGRLSACHLDLPCATFTTDKIERTLQRLKARGGRPEAVLAQPGAADAG